MRLGRLRDADTQLERVRARRCPVRAVARVGASLALAAALAGGAVLTSPTDAAGDIARAISWPTAGFNAMRTNYNGRETAIGPTNVGRIHELWRRPSGV